MTEDELSKLNNLRDHTENEETKDVHTDFFSFRNVLLSAIVLGVIIVVISIL